MNRQEIFNKAYLGVIAQGKPSVGSSGTCMYESRDGSRCGVGMLIEDKSLRQELDSLNETGISLVVENIIGGDSIFIDLPDWMINEVDLLESIQEAHDAAAAIPQDDALFVGNYKSRMTDVAKNFNLTVPEKN